MSAELRYRDWFVKYKDGKKFIFNQHRGRITHTNPIFKASIAELISLMMIKKGFDHEAIATIYGTSKSLVDNQAHHLQYANHTHVGNLFRKAKTLELDNPLALVGLAVRLRNPEKRAILLDRIEKVTKELNDDLLNCYGQLPFASLPDAKSRATWLERKQK